MTHRGILIGSTILLIILTLVAAWGMLGNTLSNKNAAAAAYQQAFQAAGQTSGGRIPVQVGISVEKIANFSIKSVAWDADFYIWFKWTAPADQPDFDPGNSFEIVAGTVNTKQKVVDQTNGDSRYELYRVTGTINYPFDVTRYPVDDHLLRLFIIDPVHPEIQYVADKQNSRISSAISIPGYRIARTIIGVETVTENTNLGNLGSPKQSARLGLSLVILRQGFGFYIKLFQALFAAVGVALLAGFFKAHEEIRFELLVGGFFAAVANSYITTTYLPDTGSMTLMDKINFLGLATIFLCMIQTVVSARFANRGEHAFSRQFDRLTFGLIALIYVALNVAVPLAALIR